MYESLASFAQTWGLLLFIALFLGAVVYALWPKNQAKFDDAARIPLEENSRPHAADEADREAASGAEPQAGTPKDEKNG